ncbi:hypothetical protein KOW79_020182 [Hemibagrus wyckioides]|uniref:Uncharacterized protein n=1 Tax=Hemibagrus wyckioides TaxID=337641 RepID=A0A9D3S9R6_9TELE|nr:hypothetical protein KOW79_020182 [Hemibagrus wyckioides]
MGLQRKPENTGLIMLSGNQRRLRIVEILGFEGVSKFLFGLHQSASLFGRQELRMGKNCWTAVETCVGGT